MFRRKNAPASSHASTQRFASAATGPQSRTQAALRSAYSFRRARVPLCRDFVAVAADHEAFGASRSCEAG